MLIVVCCVTITIILSERRIVSELSDLQKRIIDYRDKRNWEQFHNPKDLAISLSLEAAEFLEHFQWKSTEEIARHIKKNHKDVSDELMDVLYWVLLISHDLKLDILKEFERKMQKNEKKYPVSKAKGNHKKYTQL